MYYDQWENGYDPNLSNPADVYDASTNPAGVQIWGNGLAADGCAPNIAGVPVTCTDANDILHAGDVIIPYNAVPVPRDGGQQYAMDDFQTTAYNGNDGNTSSSGDWVETGDDNSATAGDIRVSMDNAQSLGYLRFMSTEANDSIDRGVDLSTGGSCAKLGFLLRQNAVEFDGTDRFALEVSNNNGSTYTRLDTYGVGAVDPTGYKTYDISAYASANTRVRFISVDALDDTTEYWSVDNVQVGWDCYLKTLFDAGDKIGASSSIAMSRAIWASGSGTYNAFAHEMYPTAEWGTVYKSPVGPSTTNSNLMFSYSALSIMASQNNTTVDIDVNGDGDFTDVGVDINDLVLQEGGSYLATGIAQGRGWWPTRRSRSC